MSDIINRQDAIDLFESYIGLTMKADDAHHQILYILKSLPSAEPELITIEEVANQLGCATIQSALYWFDFLKTLYSLGFAIIRKETK